MEIPAKIALIVGSTGLVGSHLLSLLLDSPYYSQVVALVRKPTGRSHEKLKENCVDFDKLETALSAVQAHDVFLCLGSTMKKAGSQANFRKVDYDYPLQIAQQMLANGAQQLAVVSALGAKASSKIFYNRVKGELEEELKKLNYEGLFIMQPSLLMGNRPEFRLGERIGQKLMCLADPLMVGAARQFRSINAFDVATAMHDVANSNQKGVFIIKSEQIKEFVRHR
ncbi:NAD(P)H-binding protein [bacterium]|nr:NAD(P)H-binding protein [bacterium]